MKLQKQDVVLITGCGSGIGKALALAFHQQGFKVCATARRVDAMADLAQSGIQTLALDVTSAESITQAMGALQSQGLQVGMLVNNAGFGAMGPLFDVSEAMWRKQLEVNVIAPMALARAVLPSMIKRGRGSIVNISSVSGVMPTPFAGAYCASKAAVNAMSDSLRMELKPLGIEVVTVQPGDSPYQAVREGVHARANESQAKATPADVFAHAVVRQLTQASCPAVIRMGEKSSMLPFMKRWLPDAWLDSILIKRFQLSQLKPQR